MEAPDLNAGDWTSSGTAARGSVTPRLWTPPLRDLSDPDASYGWDLIDFAEEIGVPFKPWQRWLAVHAGELLDDGRPRFRTVLALVARQNGKTVFCRVLTLYWLHIELADLVLGTSTSRDTAKESWRKVIDMAQAADALADEYDWTKAVRDTIGEECLTTLHGTRYRFAAPNRRAGRSYTVHRLILDELREHQTWDTWNAAVKAMTAVRDAQAYAITNQGDSLSVVLDSLRTAALTRIETGRGDPRLGLFEWSSPTGADPTDPHALALANPQLGDTIDLDSIIGDAARAKAAGGEELATFRTETMCIRVPLLDPAIDADAWRDCGVDPADAVDLAGHRAQVALCLDVSLDATHATLVAAAVVDGLVHLEVVRAWNGAGCTKDVRAELPEIIGAIRPRKVGWFPNGPAASIAADLKQRRGRRLPARVKSEEITGEQAAVCMGFAEIVDARQVRHPRDPLLKGHIETTGKLWRGDMWVFTRDGEHPVDGTYAAAGATHLARTLPAPLPPLVVST